MRKDYQKRVKATIYFVLAMFIISVGVDILSTSGGLRQLLAQAGDQQKKGEEKQNGAGALANKPKKEATFRLDFNKAKMEDFLKTMSELLRKNILIDHKVPGNVTIVSPRPIPVRQAYMVLKTVLAQYGFMPVEEGDIIRIVRTNEAFIMDTELRVTPDLQGFQAKDFPKDSKNITHLVVFIYAKAREVQPLLKNIATKETKIIAYDKANTIVFVGEAQEILHLISVAKELDLRSRIIESDEMRRNMHIYHLENADAEKLAPILSRLSFEMPSETKQSNSTSNDKSAQQKGQPVVRKPVTNTSFTPGKNENLAKVDIIANKETNSLIITAPPEVYRDIKRIIQQLDVMRSQVLVEALIVEVSGDGSWGAGIEWRHGSSLNSSTKELSNAYALGSSSTGLGSDYVSNAGDLPGLTLGLLKGSLATSDGTLQIPDIYAFLNYYSKDQQVNILSTPQILVKDNQDAELNVGSQIPVVSNMRITDQNTAIRSYDLKSVGIKLKLTPHINKNKYISLDIYQEVKSLLGDTSSISLDVPPIISNRDIKTQITIRDRSTIVIGGLISSSQTEIERKTPILGDIPILGWFFKRNTRTQTKTNLLVFITPYIVNSPDEMNLLTTKKRMELEKMRKQFMHSGDQD